jgi:hypothetical protein
MAPRADLPKWFLAAYSKGRDQPGLSAKLLRRELSVACQTQRTMAHKLRHRLSEDPVRPFGGFLEANETFISLPAASGAEPGASPKANAAAGLHLLTDGSAGYRSQQADLGEPLKPTPIIQDQGANVAEFIPIIHSLFSQQQSLIQQHQSRARRRQRQIRRATGGNGATAPFGATSPTAWTTIRPAAPSNAPRSPTIGSPPLACPLPSIGFAGHCLQLRRPSLLAPTHHALRRLILWGICACCFGTCRL